MREGWRKLVSDFRFSLGLQISAVLVAADVLFLLFVVCNQMTLHQFQQRYNQEMEQYRAVLNLKKNIDFTDALLYDYIKTGAVSYTHLDVYKRQPTDRPSTCFCIQNSTIRGSRSARQMQPGALNL